MKGKTVPVTWSDEKLTLLYRPGQGSNSRPPAHRSFKHHGQGVLRPYSFGHGGGCYTRKQMQTILRPLGDELFFLTIKFSILSYFRLGYRVRVRIRLTFIGFTLFSWELLSSIYFHCWNCSICTHCDCLTLEATRPRFHHVIVMMPASRMDFHDSISNDIVQARHAC